MSKKAQKEFRDLILTEEKKGKIVVMGIEGAQVMSLDNFIQQPTEGILYDLNRSPEVVLTFINDPKWVNDYAVYLTIKRLKERVTELESYGKKA